MQGTSWRQYNIHTNLFNNFHFVNHLQTITNVSFHPTTNKIASSSLDGSVHLWNLDGSVRCYKFSGHTDAVNCVNWSPSGDLMVTASSDRTVRIWRPTVLGSSSQFYTHTSAVRYVDFSPKGSKVMSRHIYERHCKFNNIFIVSW